jgi:hypothetical protein
MLLKWKFAFIDISIDNGISVAQGNNSSMKLVLSWGSHCVVSKVSERHAVSILRAEMTVPFLESLFRIEQTSVQLCREAGCLPSCDGRLFVSSKVTT